MAATLAAIATATATKVEAVRPTILPPLDTTPPNTPPNSESINVSTIEEAVDVDSAVAAADNILQRQLDIHHKKQAFDAEQAASQVQPKIQEEISSLLVQNELRPEQIKSQAH